MNGSGKTPTVETYRFADDGVVTNNPVLPLVVYRRALAEGGDRAAACERLFAQNGWPDAWRNGIYPHHHYHSTAHEVLGIAAGNARVRLGGENGQTVELHAGDVVATPAGITTTSPARNSTVCPFSPPSLTRAFPAAMPSTSCAVLW